MSGQAQQLGTAADPASPATVKVPVPAELRWLSDVIGADATLALVEVYGGTRCFVPQRSHKPKGGDRLTTVIGEEAAVRLAEIRGGEVFEVPLCIWWRIAVLHSEGLSTVQIARALVMTEGGVRRHLANIRARARHRHAA